MQQSISLGRCVYRSRLKNVEDNVHVLSNGGDLPQGNNSSNLLWHQPKLNSRGKMKFSRFMAAGMSP